MALVTPAAEIGGVIVVEPKVFSDPRGIFVETFRQEWLAPDAPTMAFAEANPAVTGKSARSKPPRSQAT